MLHPSFHQQTAYFQDSFLVHRKRVVFYHHLVHIRKVRRDIFKFLHDILRRPCTKHMAMHRLRINTKITMERTTSPRKNLNRRISGSRKKIVTFIQEFLDKCRSKRNPIQVFHHRHDARVEETISPTQTQSSYLGYVRLPPYRIRQFTYSLIIFAYSHRIHRGRIPQCLLCTSRRMCPHKHNIGMRIHSPYLIGKSHITLDGRSARIQNKQSIIVCRRGYHRHRLVFIKRLCRRIQKMHLMAALLTISRRIYQPKRII